MRTLPTAILLSLALLLAGGVFAAERGQAEKDYPPYELAAMKIVPYNQSAGTFLAEVSPDDKEGFWNALDLSLLVTVEVSGTPGSYSPRRRIEVTAREGNRLILKRSARLGVLDERAGRYYVPVWLYGSFCQPVAITARLTGQRRISALRRKVYFNCGE